MYILDKKRRSRIIRFICHWAQQGLKGLPWFLHPLFNFATKTGAESSAFPKRAIKCTETNALIPTVRKVAGSFIVEFRIYKEVFSALDFTSPHLRGEDWISGILWTTSRAVPDWQTIPALSCTSTVQVLWTSNPFRACCKWARIERLLWPQVWKTQKNPMGVSIKSKTTWGPRIVLSDYQILIASCSCRVWATE